jgi:hypothetical protein
MKTTLKKKATVIIKQNCLLFMNREAKWEAIQIMEFQIKEKKELNDT